MYIDFNKIWLYLDIFAFSSSSHLHFPMACSREFRSGEQVNEAANLLPELGLCSPTHKASPGRSRGGHSMWVVEICVVFLSSSYYEVVLANQGSQRCAPGRLAANSLVLLWIAIASPQKNGSFITARLIQKSHASYLRLDFREEAALHHLFVCLNIAKSPI